MSLTPAVGSAAPLTTSSTPSTTGISARTRSSRGRDCWPTVACHHCKKLFQRKPSQITKYRKHFCSKDCHDADQRGGVTQRRCAHCTQPMRLPPSRPQIHCSRKCAALAKAAHVTLTCAHCRQQYQRTRGEVAKAARNGWTKTFCSKKCQLDNTTQQAQAAAPPCKKCGNPVTGRRGAKSKTFCSAQCRKTFSVVSVYCQQCGVTVERLRYELAKADRNGHNGRFCSKQCMGDFLAASKGRRCETCGATIERAQGRRYCSDTCRITGIRARRPRLTFPDSKDCPQCGATFRPKTSRHTYCQRSCANTAHALRMVGRGNSRYKDGKSYASWFRAMRPLILERDQHACVACGSLDKPIVFTRQGKTQRRSSLVIHHLNEDPSDNRHTNLVTLCHVCHKIHHASTTTPYPWLAQYTAKAWRSTTSKWRETVISLRMKYSSITAS